MFFFSFLGMFLELSEIGAAIPGYGPLFREKYGPLFRFRGKFAEKYGPGAAIPYTMLRTEAGIAAPILGGRQFEKLTSVYGIAERRLRRRGLKTGLLSVL